MGNGSLLLSKAWEAGVFKDRRVYIVHKLREEFRPVETVIPDKELLDKPGYEHYKKMSKYYDPGM